MKFEVKAFETDSHTSEHIIQVLESLLDECNFAIIIMTAEDETPEGKFRARQNVIHEIGLFQGRVGFGRIIIIQQEGIEDF